MTRKNQSRRVEGTQTQQDEDSEGEDIQNERRKHSNMGDTRKMHNQIIALTQKQDVDMSQFPHSSHQSGLTHEREKPAEIVVPILMQQMEWRSGQDYLNSHWS